MSFISKTFGGLDKSYYFRHLFFGGLLFILLEYLVLKGSQGAINGKVISNTILFAVLLFLYPYSRFVYETIMDFIFGKNVFFVNTFLFLITKFITMAICYVFGLFIAPIGLLYLYFYHSKQEKNVQNYEE